MCPLFGTLKQPLEIYTFVGPYGTSIQTLKEISSPQLNKMIYFYLKASLQNLTFGLFAKQKLCFQSSYNIVWDIYRAAKNTTGSARYFLVGNKVDLIKSDSSVRQVTKSAAEDMAKQNHFESKVYETSAKTGENISRLFNDICK